MKEEFARRGNICKNFAKKLIMCLDSKKEGICEGGNIRKNLHNSTYLDSGLWQVKLRR